MKAPAFALMERTAARTAWGWYRWGVRPPRPHGAERAPSVVHNLECLPVKPTPLRLAAAGLLSLAAVWPAAAHAAAPRYTIVDLGVLPGTTDSQAFGVSPNGNFVAGRALGDAGYPAAAWALATRTPLPNLPGRRYASANAVNNAGQIVGTSSTTPFGSSPLPVMWLRGQPVALPLPAGEGFGRAYAVNAAGVAAGSVGSGSGERAAVFRTGGSAVLSATAPDGSSMTTALAINDAGIVAGQGTDPRNAALNVALLYRLGDASMVRLPPLPGNDSALLFGLSNAGHAVGSSMIAQGSGLPFVWTAATGSVAIPLPPRTSTGAGQAVNSDGWVVGNAGGLYSVPWLYVAGTTYSLASLVRDPDWDLNRNTSAAASGISEDGTIVGTGVYRGAVHAFAMLRLSAGE